MLYDTVRQLATRIEEARLSTQNPTELEKLDFAHRMVVHGREFLDLGDYPAAWLRLNGAVGFLRMAGVSDLAAVQVQLNQNIPQAG